MDHGPWMAGEVELRAEAYELGRFRPAGPDVSLRVGEPVWPTLDFRTLKMAGHPRLVRAAYRSVFPSPALQRTYGRQWPPYLAAGEPACGAPVRRQMPRELAGPLPARTPVAAAIEIEAPVTLTRIMFHRARAVFPSGGLDTSYARPAFFALASAVRIESAPGFPEGFYLPERPREAAVDRTMPAPEFLASSIPATMNMAAPAWGKVRPVSFAQPGIWLPEWHFSLVDVSRASALESMVGEWIMEVPRPSGLPRTLRAVSAPRRAPRPTIPMSPGWLRAVQLPAAALVAGDSPLPAGARRIVPAMMTRPAQPAAFRLPTALPSAKHESGVLKGSLEAAHAWLGPPSAMRALENARLAVEQLAPTAPVVSLPLSRMAEASREEAAPGIAALVPLALPPALARARATDIDLERGVSLFSARTPVLPEVAALGKALESVPASAAYMPVGLPASFRGRRSAPVGAGQVFLPVSSIAPLLPTVSEALASQRLLTFAPMSPGGLPSPVRPAPAVRSDAGSSAPASFAVAAILPATPRRAHELGVEPSGFSMTLPAPAVQPSASAVAGGAVLSASEPVHVVPVAPPEFERGLAACGVIPEAETLMAAAGPRGRAVIPGLSFAPELRTPESGGGAEVRVPGAEYAPAGAVRPSTTRPEARMVGPIAGVLAASLPENGALASTASLAPAEGLSRPPLPMAGAVREGIADLAPCLPPVADPQVGSFASALAGRTSISGSDLQSVGLPRVHARPARPLTLPGADIPAPDLSLLGLPVPFARHALPEREILPPRITPAVRERRPAESLRQDVAVPEPHLPELSSAERGHVLVSGASFETPVAAASAAARRHPPAGAVTRAVPPKFPAPIAFSAAVHLGAGEPADLEVRAATRTLAWHPMGRAAFPSNEAQVLDPQPGSLGAAVLSMDGLKIAECASAVAVRPSTTRPEVQMVGPLAGVFDVSLPAENALASTATLAPVEGFTRRPLPMIGAVPEGIANLAPRVSAAPEPQIASCELALAERANIPSPDLQPVGLPKVRTRPAQPSSLPRVDIPAQDLSMLELPVPSVWHALPELEIIPPSITPAVRERRPADSLRQDVPVPEPRLPELSSAERDHVLVSAAPVAAPLAAASAGMRPHPPAGAVTRAVSPEFPAPVAFSTAVNLGAGEPAGLGVRAAAWAPAWRSMGWAAFPPNQAQVPDPRAAVPGAIVLSVSGLETIERPLPKVPVAASPLQSQLGFPLADPLRPSTEVAAEPRELPEMPPAPLLPSAFRGTPQAPRATSATIPVPLAGLPGFDLGISARLHTAEQGFETPAPLRAPGAVAPGSARRVAAPIHLTDGIYPPEARLSPVYALLLAGAEILPAVGFPDARKVVARTQPVRGTEFPLADPVHAQSQAIAPCHTLGQSPLSSVPGRSQVGMLRVSAPAPVGFVPQPAELLGPRAVDVTVSLMAAGSERVPPRPRAGAPAPEKVGWQAREQECTSAHFWSVESRPTPVEWPTPAARYFQAVPKPPAFSVRLRVAPPSGAEFPCPGVLWPESAGFTQALRSTPLSILSAPPNRQDPQTARKKVRLEPVFRQVRRPGRLPVFHARDWRAAMPSGVFVYFDPHEDFEDFGTMGVAPSYEAPLLNPQIPAVELRMSFAGDVDCPYFMAPEGLEHNLAANAAGAIEFRATPPRPLLQEGVDPIPVEFDPRLAEAGKSQGLVGALKTASRFFKLTTLGVPGLMLFSALPWNAPGGSVRETRVAVLEEDFCRVFCNGVTAPIDEKMGGSRSDGRSRVGEAGVFGDSREGRTHPHEGGVPGGLLG